MTLRPGSGTMTGDQGGTIEGSGNLSVSGVQGGSIAKHLKTLIKMENVGSYSVILVLTKLGYVLCCTKHFLHHSSQTSELSRHFQKFIQPHELHV